MYSRARALAKARSLTARTKLDPPSSEPKKPSSMACCEPARIDSSAATSAGKGNWRQRVNARG